LASITTVANGIAIEDRTGAAERELACAGWPGGGALRTMSTSAKAMSCQSSKRGPAARAPLLKPSAISASVPLPAGQRGSTISIASRIVAIAAATSAREYGSSARAGRSRRNWKGDLAFDLRRDEVGEAQRRRPDARVVQHRQRQAPRRSAAARPELRRCSGGDAGDLPAGRRRRARR
jgi:hypothetical protein